MLSLLRIFAWLACVIYSTIPQFWLLIHPRAEYWRSRSTSPYQILLPIWIGMWAVVAGITVPWRGVMLYTSRWMWFPAAALFCAGVILYKLSHANFTLAQLGGFPEVRRDHGDQRLITTGIRSHIRHPVYLGHLCEMLAWSTGTGLAVCWGMTGFALVAGAVMIHTEDEELAKRFGREYLAYRNKVPAILFKLGS